MLGTLLLCAALCCAPRAALPAAVTSTTRFAVLSVAEGPPAEVIRGAVVYGVTRGALIRPGDLIESGPGGLLIMEIRTGTVTAAIVALGPMTRAQWAEQADAGITLNVIKGWVKVDTASPSAPLEVRSSGPLLGAVSHSGTYVLHVGAGADQVFYESGDVALWLPVPDGTGTTATSRQGEFTARGAGGLRSRRGVDPAFLNELPGAFRDPLPTGLADTVHANTEPQRIRDVTYADIADWLTAPLEWRRGFVERFRPRLRDTAFRRALDARISVHPEWQPLLHARSTLPTASAH